MNSVELKQSLKAGHSVLGTTVFEFGTPGIARMLATTGVDFVFYDMEHSGFGIDTIRALMAQARATDVTALVRPPANLPHLIGPILDTGAHGIIVPMVETAEQAERLVDACKYYPLGHRGTGFGLAHDDFQTGNVMEKMRDANESTVCVALIETEEGVRNVDDIARVPGLDVVWIGHFDLSQSLGIPGEFEHPRFTSAVQRVLEAANAHGIAAGMMVSDPAQAIDRIRQGFRCVAYWGDVWLLQRAIKQGISAIRAGIGE
ncbi:MAG TPA: aldolase/citrate lyase family protein [Chloroflexota bacterium]|nr:aldolase/citrate lyase family protein [Chloroflexota bacterium]